MGWGWRRIGPALLALCAAMAWAQTDRLSGPVDRHQMTPLKDNVSPLARPEFDQGPVDPSRKLSSMTLMLKPTADQQKALDQLLMEQQDPMSPNYHQWLSPEQYADRFGLSRGDIARITAWLQLQGFRVDEVARGRNYIVFSGTAEQAEKAFQTELHRYNVNGEQHFANVSSPSLPAVLVPLVIGIRGLDDFHPKPPGHRLGKATLGPKYTTTNGTHYLAPDDLAVIYDIGAVYNAGYEGSGQNLVVAGQTKVNLADITSFRSAFNLPGNPPQLVLVPSSVDPGITGDEIEADLDLEWSGAVARKANIIFVYSTDVFTSVQYAISQNLAPVISFSYGICELGLSGTDAQSAQAVAQQANAQGITWIVSSGDSGAAGCDRQGQSPQAQYGVATNIFASIPEVTGVGGTQFNEGSGTYWGGDGFAIGYIPEVAWNESGPNGLSSSGGGLSIFYPKPAWQIGPGTPSVNARASPDVALTAANHDGYIIVTEGNATSVGGTSAAAPSFAGMITLLNQYEVAQGFQPSPGQGNLNPNLYRLFAASHNIFHDIVAGSNIVACQRGTTDCSSGSYGYSAGVGYDPVTGIGTVDAANLIAEWNQQVVTTTTAVSASPSSFGLNASSKLTATVTAVGSGTAPTGTVAFNFGNTALGNVTIVNSGGKATATITIYGSQLPSGHDTIVASYSGNSKFGASSGSVTVNVSVPAGNSAIVPSADPNPVFEEKPDSDGYSWFYTINLTEVAGTSTTLTGFTIDGDDYSSEIEDFFGSSAIPAFGTLSTGIRTKGLTVPANVVFGFSGVDPGGHHWTQQFSVPFYGNQITASMALSSFPETIRQDPTASEDCQWLQYLGVEERNGHSVQINRFVVGSEFGTVDLTSRILEFFPSTTLQPLGTLVGSICWSGVSIPQMKNYEIDGVDDSGTTILTTSTAEFDTAATGGALATSVNKLNVSVPGSEQFTVASINVALRAGEQWSVSVFPSNRNTRWLTVFPLSGSGPTTLTVIADSTGLAAGTYKTALVFQSTNTLPQFIAVPVQFTVGNNSLGAPSISAVVNGASFLGGAVVPGEIATLFGTNLTGNSGINIASQLPLPTNFLNVSVTVDGLPAAIFAVDNVNGQQQINFQVPWEVAGQSKAQISVNNGSSSSSPVSIVVAAQPGIFNYASGGNTFGAILHSNFKLANTANPAVGGETVLIYCTGLGTVNSTPADGHPSTGQTTRVTPTVTIGGKNATVKFTGLAPGFVGLNQVNVVVPSGLHGNQKLVITSSGASSNTVLLPIK